MEELLTTKGTPFREKELASFFACCTDTENETNVYYEDYIAALFKAQQPVPDMKTPY